MRSNHLRARATNNQDAKALTDLGAQIERITYFNDENGYTIAKVKAKGYPDLVTIVGHLMAPRPGEVLKLTGQWTNHPKYGEQFKVVRYRTEVPATVYGIQKYLGSGLVKGIGPVMAKRIVARFGEETLNIIEKNVKALEEVDGIGAKRIEMIRTAWEAQKEIRDIMIFLQSHGVSSGFAAKIYRYYGTGAIEVLQQNPYRLATDVYGIGFLSADRIAEQLGFAKDSPLRAEAGILYVLHRLADEGHVYYPFVPLVETCVEMLSVESAVVEKALWTIASEKRIVIEELGHDSAGPGEESRAVYLSKHYLAETTIASRLRALAQVKDETPVDPDRAVGWVQTRLSIRLARSQVEAVKCALENKVMILTGGPGTGKTTIINAILMVFKRLGARTLAAAPTGRAAKRMQETTGHVAKTIHRLLEYSPSRGGFQRNESDCLKCDLLVVDETSMIDTMLMYHLLKAVPMGANLIMVGDVNQLPSVGPGSVLKDVITSGVLPVIELKEIFRQAKESLIIVNAHRIHKGSLPLFRPSQEKLEDFYFIEQEDTTTVVKTIVELVSNRIPRRFGLDPFEDIQVLTPMHKGAVGAGNLNAALQEALNPSGEALLRGNRTFKVRDRVMQIRNNYDKEVFNGDIGRILVIDQERQEAVISFDGRQIEYDFSDLEELVLAYAVSVHKSQGSEYPAVIIPLLLQHYMLLQRNLIYTAVTRGRRLVVMIGARRALAIGVANQKTDQRCSRLRQRLTGSGSPLDQPFDLLPLTSPVE
jgi:exodeoxyribonuclease V alpha subunit